MLEKYFKQIADELSIRPDQVKNTVALLNDGATIPFISRYRKEFTDNLDEQAIARIRDRLNQLEVIEKRRKAILNSIEEQGLMNDELKKQILEATALTELEDIYLPYKPKRKTRATIAKAKGLEPLAKIIMSQKYEDIEDRAEQYIDDEKGVADIDEALKGARDIIAEWVNESQFARSRVRGLYQREAMISSHVIKGREQEGLKYKTYFEWEENLSKAPSHRIMAMLRGENEGFLGVKVMPSGEKVIDNLERIFVKGNNASAKQVQLAVEDSFKRLLHPSLETEMKSMAKEKADEKAIEVFVENLRQLLLSAPLGQKAILALDPGFRTGCKLVCLDKQGNLLHNETIYPHPPQNEVAQAIKKVLNLVDAYKIEAIAIGNGTAGRQTEKFIKSIRIKIIKIIWIINIFNS